MCEACVQLVGVQDLKPAMKAFKAACLFAPLKISAMRPSPSDVDDLSVFPDFFEGRSQEGASLYLSVSEDVSPVIDLIAWWKNQEFCLPNWSHASKYVTLIQPSSATAERVFFFVTRQFI